MEGQLETLEYIAGGWALMAALGLLLAYSLCKIASLADAASAQEPSVVAAGPLLRSGYRGLVLDRLADQATTILGVDASCIVVRDKRQEATLVVAAQHGLDVDAVGTRIRAGDGLVGLVLESGQPAIVPRVGEPAFTLPLESGHRVHAAAAAPVFARGAAVGALTVASGDPRRGIAFAELELLTGLARLVGLALERHERGPGLAATVEDQVSVLTQALAVWDGHTDQHSGEVLELARLVGERLGLDEPELVELELAARLHDVGKIRIPGGLLRKPGSLSSHELAMMRRHAVWGSELVAKIPGLTAVAAVIRFHHERYDGRGYPSGLQRERIPLAARIVTVCDAYKAMTSDRPYRPALTPEQAAANLEAGRGTQFDPAVVDAVRAVLSAAKPALV